MSEKRLNNIDLDKRAQAVFESLKRMEQSLKNIKQIQQTFYFSSIPQVILGEAQKFFENTKAVSNTLKFSFSQTMVESLEKIQQSFLNISQHLHKFSEVYFESLKSLGQKVGIKNVDDKTISELTEEIYRRTQNSRPDNLTEIEETLLAEIIAYYEEKDEKEQTVVKRTAKKERKLQVLSIFAPKEIYIPLPQDKPLNTLTFILTDKRPKHIDLFGKATFESEDLIMTIENYEELKRRTSAVKFLDALIIAGKNQSSSLVRIPLADYMNLRGLKDEKEARKQISEDIELLKHIEFKFTYKGDWKHISIYGGVAGIYRGIITFRFTPEFFELIPKDRYAYLPKEYFQTNDKRNPHTAYFIKKIALHKRMNLGKPNENIISVKALIEASPLFPRGEELQEKAKRHFTQLILEPFERDMDVIKTFKWNYVDEQPFDFLSFINSKVAITWIDYPNTVKLARRKKKSVV